MAIRKISFELKITEHTDASVYRSHLYLSDKRQPHSTLLGGRYQKAFVPAWTHPPCRLWLFLLHTDNKQLCRHIWSTPSKADVAVWTTNNRQVPVKTHRFYGSVASVLPSLYSYCSSSNQRGKGFTRSLTYDVSLQNKPLWAVHTVD